MAYCCYHRESLIRCIVADTVAGTDNGADAPEAAPAVPDYGNQTVKIGELERLAAAHSPYCLRATKMSKRWDSYWLIKALQGSIKYAG